MPKWVAVLIILLLVPGTKFLIDILKKIKSLGKNDIKEIIKDIVFVIVYLSIFIWFVVGVVKIFDNVLG